MSHSAARTDVAEANTEPAASPERERSSAALLTRLREHAYKINALPFLRGAGVADAAALLWRLDAGHPEGGVALDSDGAPRVDEAAIGASPAILQALARNGFIELFAPASGVVFSPSRADFTLHALPRGEGQYWRISRLAYMHFEEGRFHARSPLSDGFLTLPAKAAVTLHRFHAPAPMTSEGDMVERLLARAGVIQPCDASGRTLDDTEPHRRQWDFHELLFHSLSRIGRSEKPIGATYAFRDSIAPPPALKPNPWRERALPLPRPDLDALARTDMPLTAAIESRRSIRRHAIVGPTATQLGEFLYRTMRVRERYANAYGEFTSRPYPNGGACYEQELYVTVDISPDLPRGFYYYDAVEHSLCMIAPPDAEMEGLLQEAATATANQGRPQVLLTIASRFARFNWKYSSMAYAAQLKNIGAIFQTMYLVATAMKLAPCALGLGNTDRFCRMAGLEWIEEGSIGEFMLGCPAADEIDTTAPSASRDVSASAAATSYGRT